MTGTEFWRELSNEAMRNHRLDGGIFKQWGDLLSELSFAATAVAWLDGGKRGAVDSLRIRLRTAAQVIEGMLISTAPPSGDSPQGEALMKVRTTGGFYRAIAEELELARESGIPLVRHWGGLLNEIYFAKANLDILVAGDASVSVVCTLAGRLESIYQSVVEMLEVIHQGVV